MAVKKGYISEGIKIIFRYLAEYKKDLIVLSVLGVVSAIANGIVPYLVGRLFDAILSPAPVFAGAPVEMPIWLFFIILWGITQIIANVIDWIVNTRSEWLGAKLHTGYMSSSFSRLLKMPVSFHANRKMGEITNKLNRASNSLQIISGDVIINLAPQFLSLIVAFAITFFINAALAGILIFGVVLYVIILIKTASPLASLQRKMNKAYGKAYGDSYDAVFNVRTVKQSVSETIERKKIFKNFRINASRFYIQMITIWQKLTFYQRLIIMATQLAVFVASIIFIQKGQMTIGELVMFNGYAAMLFAPFAVLGNNWQTIQNGIIALEQGDKILSSPPENYNPVGAPILSDIKGEIVFDNVSFTYQKKQKTVLDGVSFKVSPGEVVALVGESGEGKSTLIDLISGYYFSRKGKVLIDGHNVKNLNLRFLRGKIAVVPQEVVLFNDTIKTNIKYGSFGASDEKVEEAAKKAHCLEFIEKFPKQWKQIVGERGVKLSVGQKQRVAIARAILRDPRILILDEPTSALDAKLEKSIQDSLDGLMRGRTTFIIAHRLSTVRRADKILVIKDGKIAEEGNHEQLMRIPNGIYRALYELQIGLR